MKLIDHRKTPIFANPTVKDLNAVLSVLFLSEDHGLPFGWLLNILIYMDSIICNIIVIYNDRRKRAIERANFFGKGPIFERGKRENRGREKKR